MKSYNPKLSQKEIESLVVEAFQSLRETIDAFERLTMAAWRRSLAKDETDQTARVATVAAEVADHDGTLVCTVKEACRRTGLGRTRIYQAISSGELRAMKCGHRTLIPAFEMTSLGRILHRMDANQSNADRRTHRFAKHPTFFRLVK
jgi:excisionase family DNA binding protein